LAIFGPTVRSASLPLVFYKHSPEIGRRWLELWARKTQPDLILCNSEFTAASSSQLFPGVHTETVYCPVSSSTFEDLNKGKGEIRTRMQVPEHVTVIIQVSRMDSAKGHSLHLEALSLLKDTPDWVCWQIGGAQSPTEVRYLGELKRVAAQLGISERVRFLDHRTDVRRLLAEADIFCQPNTRPEPFGIVFIEALYAQLPVITTNIGGAREIVDDSCGVLVPDGDASSIAAALRRLIQNPDERKRLGTAGPARAQFLCDPAKQLAQYHQALGFAVHPRQAN
jgi:glycosyltransferase involved in cell wall biosynthesis